MKNQIKQWLKRILLVVLCAVLAAGGAFFAESFKYGWEWLSGTDPVFSDSQFVQNYVYDCLQYLSDYSIQGGVLTETVVEGYCGSSFSCVQLCDGKVVLDTTAGDVVHVDDLEYYDYTESIVPGSAAYYEQAIWNGSAEMPEGGTVVYVYPLEDGNSSGASEEYAVVGVEHEYVLRGYLNYPIEPYSGLYAEYSFFQLMLALKNWALPLAVLCFALTAALVFVLARDAYRRRKRGESGDPLTRLPFDAFAVGVVILTLLLSAGLRALGEDVIFSMLGPSYTLIGVVFRMMYPIIRTFLWTAACVVLLRSALLRDWRSEKEKQLLLSRLSAEMRVLFPLGLGAAFLVIGLLAWAESVILVGFVLILLSGVFSVLLFRQFRQLRKASERLAAGDLESGIAEDRFWPGVREQASALNRIGDGIKTAVDEQLKGERLKTELITNVSHDLKTPITSIVSCVDLMRKPETTPEQAAEYLEMLERQCRKLQKLADDLVEASKASSGAIDVAYEPTDVRELLNQSVGEFAERLEQQRITPVVTLPEEPCVLNTDGQLLWRILDNLLRNICKYAQPDTRAYIGLETSPAETVISLKNVSATPLNVSAETLMERFVRGDASRSTEGSGLGLSIAQSLTRLLGGELILQIDGDLFKAEIRLPS